MTLLLALPALGQKLTTEPGGVAGATPTFQVITGNPLTVHVGSDGSFQVFNAAVPGQGQIYPGSCTTVADMGIFADFGGILYAPDFGNHTCGSATGSIGTYTPWTQVSLSAVTGTGTAADPFTVVIVLDAAATGVRLTATVTYINGENLFRIAKVFTSTAAAAVTMRVFEGADIFLAGSDSGIPFLAPASNSPGGQVCSGPSYTILFIPITPATAYSANGYSTVWAQIGAAQLSNTVATGCIDNGAANQWDRTLDPGGTFTITSAASFGEIPPIAGGPTANVPTLDTKALVILAVLLAAIGFVVVRRLLG
ncbi:MAG: hypothetical protein ABR576_14635 [Thermoanaerobaculia bacterium]